jgi:hypothetical protein
MYGTTPVFLEYFALRHLEELPRADELAIALRLPNQPEATLADRPVDVAASRADAETADSPSETADSVGFAEASV